MNGRRPNPFEASGVENFPDLEALFRRFSTSPSSPFSRLDLSLETLSRVTGGMANFTEDTTGFDFPPSKSVALDAPPTPMPWRALSAASPLRAGSAMSASPPNVSLDLMLSPIRPILGGGHLSHTPGALSPFGSPSPVRGTPRSAAALTPSAGRARYAPRYSKTPTARDIFSPASCPPLAPTPQKQLRFDLGPRQLRYDTDVALSPMPHSNHAEAGSLPQPTSPVPSHSPLPSSSPSVTSSRQRQQGEAHSIPYTFPAPSSADTTGKVLPGPCAEVASASTAGLEAVSELRQEEPPAPTPAWPSSTAAPAETGAALATSSDALPGSFDPFNRRGDRRSGRGRRHQEPRPARRASWGPADHLVQHGPAEGAMASLADLTPPRPAAQRRRARRRPEGRDQQLLRLFQRLLQAMEEAEADSSDGASTESGSFSGPDRGPLSHQSLPSAIPIAEAHPSDPVSSGVLESSTNLNVSSLTASDGPNMTAGKPPRTSAERATQTTPPRRPSPARLPAAAPEPQAALCPAAGSSHIIGCACSRPLSSSTHAPLKASLLGLCCSCESRTYLEAARGRTVLSTSLPPWPATTSAWSPPPAHHPRSFARSSQHSRWLGWAGAATQPSESFRLTSSHRPLFHSSGRSTSVPPFRCRSASPSARLGYEEYASPRWLAEWRRRNHPASLHPATASGPPASPPAPEYAALLRRLAATTAGRRRRTPPSTRRYGTMLADWTDSSD